MRPPRRAGRAAPRRHCHIEQGGRVLQCGVSGTRYTAASIAINQRCRCKAVMAAEGAPRPMLFAEASPEPPADAAR